MIDYTLVVGVDLKHLEQLLWVWPTWIKHKPSLLKVPMALFVDREELNAREVQSNLDIHPNLRVYSWPPDGVRYTGSLDGKWDNAQRYKMLAGFVHVPASWILTSYWLKIDTDTVATGVDDWIDPDWFAGNPAIVSQGWHYTKPPDQMIHLDNWASRNDLFHGTNPLNLVPKQSENKVKHKRIISWCAFFNTQMTRQASYDASMTCGDYKLPVPSQDGYLWYHAVRSGRDIRRVDMKSRGWKHCSSNRSILATIRGEQDA